MSKKKYFECHDFYCINCGQLALSLPRSGAQQRERFHRKRLYCFHCKKEINCIECKTEKDVFDFKIIFEKGEFKNEAEESLSYVRSTCIR